MTWGDCFQKKISAQYVPRTSKATERAQAPNTIPRIPHMATAPVLTESAVGQSGLSTEQCTELADLQNEPTATDGKTRRKLTRLELKVAIALRDKGMSYREIGAKLDRHHSSIAVALEPYEDNRQLAGRRLLGGSDKMAARFLAKARPAEILDFLSRSNIGVLQPAEQTSRGSGVQVMVGINLPGLPEGRDA